MARVENRNHSPNKQNGAKREEWAISLVRNEGYAQYTVRGLPSALAVV